MFLSVLNLVIVVVRLVDMLRAVHWKEHHLNGHLFLNICVCVYWSLFVQPHLLNQCLSIKVDIILYFWNILFRSNCSINMMVRAWVWYGNEPLPTNIIKNTNFYNKIDRKIGWKENWREKLWISTHKMLVHKFYYYSGFDR